MAQTLDPKGTAHVRFFGLRKNHQEAVGVSSKSKIKPGHKQDDRAATGKDGTHHQVNRHLRHTGSHTIAVLIFGFAQVSGFIRIRVAPAPEEVLGQVHGPQQIKDLQEAAQQDVVDVEVGESRQCICQNVHHLTRVSEKLLQHVQYGAHDGRHKQDEDQLECKEPVLKLQLCPGTRLQRQKVVYDGHEQCWQTAHEHLENTGSHHTLQKVSGLWILHADDEGFHFVQERGYHGCPDNEDQEKERPGRQDTSSSHLRVFG
mmetsp:Transcript_65933/g.133939  ORF Transcript_65933/g.133939 Transcript_65933/m.133939 type:complete len:259 (-) Transcript_65933:1376-2152(-)